MLPVRFIQLHMATCLHCSLLSSNLTDSQIPTSLLPKYVLTVFSSPFLLPWSKLLSSLALRMYSTMLTIYLIPSPVLLKSFLPRADEVIILKYTSSNIHLLLKLFNDFLFHIKKIQTLHSESQGLT